MHYYQKNIADYRKDTTHLTMVEHGAYTRLIDQYYLDEEPLTLDEAKLMRTHCARTNDEIQAIKNVLSDFFIKTDNGYIHSRCDREIERYHSKSKKAKESANARWGKKKVSESNADAMRTHTEGNANQQPITNNQQPITNNKEKDLVASAPADCPQEEIKKLYHEILPMLPKIKIWNDKRKKILRARWRESTKHQSLEFWERYFNRIKTSLFLTGRAGGDRPFTPTLEWLITESNFIKVIEGNYHND
ncbi:MAG: YdaU family protein [Gammaproteobacteria bacterium]|nr:YdaU family protein [Gammaproteobacteria bacterium]